MKVCGVAGKLSRRTTKYVDSFFDEMQSSVTDPLGRVELPGYGEDNLSSDEPSLDPTKEFVDPTLS